MVKLYDIVNTMTDLLEDYAAAETEAEREEILKLLAESKEQLQVKAESCAKKRQDFDGDVDKIDAEIQRLTQKKLSLIAKSEGLRRYIGACLGEGNKLKTPLFSFYWMPSTSVEADGVKEARDLPKEFVRIVPQKYEVDKEAIKLAYKKAKEEGVVFALPPGVKVNEKKSLVIR